jgi:hypothetical protein
LKLQSESHEKQAAEMAVSAAASFSRRSIYFIKAAGIADRAHG